LAANSAKLIRNVNARVSDAYNEHSLISEVISSCGILIAVRVHYLSLEGILAREGRPKRNVVVTIANYYSIENFRLCWLSFRTIGHHE
jgi:hypothetical protein